MYKSAKARLFIVAGMHRSGTSAVTRGLKALGVELGDRLWPPNEQVNAKGFWEDMDINALNIEMMGALHTDWHYLSPIRADQIDWLVSSDFFLRATTLLRAKVGMSPRFGFKDPRVAKLLPFWKKVAESCEYEVNFLIMTRHPLSVAASLRRREDFDAEKSHLLWLVHMLESVTATSGFQRVLVDYDRLMLNPGRELERIATAFQLTGDEESVVVYKSEFLDETLRHTTFGLRDLLDDIACTPLVTDVYKVLLAAAADELLLDSRGFQKQLENWLHEFSRLVPLLQLADKLWRSGASLRASVADKERNISALNDQLAAHNVESASQRDVSNSFERVIGERETIIAQLNLALVDREIVVSRLDQSLTDARVQIASLVEVISEAENAVKTEKIARENSQLKRNQEREELRQEITALQGQIAVISNSFLVRLLAPLLSTDARAALRANGWGMQSAQGSETVQSIMDANLSGSNYLQMELDNKVVGSQTIDVASAAALNSEALLVHEGQQFIEAAYTTLLKRRPDPGGLSFYKQRLQNGVSKLQILYEISASPEGRVALVELGGLREKFKQAQLPVL